MIANIYYNEADCTTAKIRPLKIPNLFISNKHFFPLSKNYSYPSSVRIKPANSLLQSLNDSNIYLLPEYCFWFHADEKRFGSRGFNALTNLLQCNTLKSGKQCFTHGLLSARRVVTFLVKWVARFLDAKNK